MQLHYALGRACYTKRGNNLHVRIGSQLATAISTHSMYIQSDGYAARGAANQWSLGCRSERLNGLTVGNLLPPHDVRLLSSCGRSEYAQRFAEKRMISLSQRSLSLAA